MAKPQKLTVQNIPFGGYVFIAIMMIVGAIAVGYLGIYEPSQEEYLRAEQQLQNNETQLEDLEYKEAECNLYHKENERLEKRLANLSAKLPSTDEDLNIFLKSVDTRARSSRVQRWVLFKLDGRVPKGEVDAIQIRMEFVATYEATLMFFWELTSMGDGVKINNREPLINIRDVTIRREEGSNGKASLTTLVKVSCIAETYLYTGRTAAEAAAAAAEGNHN
ncbi:MAG: type 4a pilus biogenesis protein PilO [Proteobacteria bacterium]|nr:type 4a pilus biogenesis protein PilO [Pseudomonadota bacterium]